MGQIKTCDECVAILGRVGAVVPDPLPCVAGGPVELYVTPQNGTGPGALMVGVMVFAARVGHGVIDSVAVPFEADMGPVLDFAVRYGHTEPGAFVTMVAGMVAVLSAQQGALERCRETARRLFKDLGDQGRTIQGLEAEIRRLEDARARALDALSEAECDVDRLEGMVDEWIARDRLAASQAAARAEAAKREGDDANPYVDPMAGSVAGWIIDIVTGVVTGRGR